jgi:hypothetical protein
VDGELLLTVAAVLVLSAANLMPRYLGNLHPGTPRPVLSLFGGFATAYVFVHLLPAVVEAQERLDGSVTDGGGDPRETAFLLALVGLTTFYGIELAARSSSRRVHGIPGQGTERGTYVASMMAFVAYNALVGYVVAQQVEADGAGAAVLLAVALAMHLVVNDASLRDHHQERYERNGRWILAAAVPVGWLVGLADVVPETAAAAVLAFLAGGIVLNVLKDEVPSEQEGRFLAFAVGAVSCTALLLLV